MYSCVVLLIEKMYIVKIYVQWKDAGFLVISCTTTFFLFSFLGSELSFSVSMFLTVPGLLRLRISVDMILMSTPSTSATGY